MNDLGTLLVWSAIRPPAGDGGAGHVPVRRATGPAAGAAVAAGARAAPSS